MLLIKGVRHDLAGLNAMPSSLGVPSRRKTACAVLLRETRTVTIAHARTEDLPSVCRRADILVAVVGQPELIRGAGSNPVLLSSTSDRARRPTRRPEIG
ncbi:hypothetical protein [Bradyrhizobium sp. WSM1743]|uniref:hypothetical protein n=1 Tax=Bradyrhizobium sp. WSM1743 TaxID=318996 RepID=UPI00352988A3